MQVAVSNQIWTYREIESSGGHGGTPLLVLHGWGRSGSEWVEIAKKLKHKTYILDLPGFGGSSLPEVSDIYEYSELVVEFLKYMQIPKVIVIGHSLGGRIGVVMAAKHSEMVDKLILIDPAGAKQSSIKRQIINCVAKLFGWVPNNIRSNFINNFMDEDYKNSPTLRKLYRAVVKYDLRVNFSEVKCETLVIWGEKDPILPLSLTKVYRDKIPNCRIRVIWEAGHDPHLSHSRELCRIMEEVWN